MTNKKDIKYLLIIHHESGDEVHFTVLKYAFYRKIKMYLNSTTRTQQEVESMLDVIYNYRVENLMCQSYVLEDYSKISKYNIVKCIHLPEMGC
jgi:hypothetical protein